MSSHSRPGKLAKKILILAGDTDGNLGDLAIVSATCDAIRSVLPDAEISIVSSSQERDRLRLNLLPIRRGWRGFGNLFAAARQADLVICGGGGLFQDDDSLIKMPYWAIRLAAIRLVSQRIAGLSIGAGPLDHPVSRLFARLALKMLRPISVRDPLAHGVLVPLTRQTVEIIPDPAFMLESAKPPVAKQALLDANVPSGAMPLIGVALRRWFHTDSNLIPHKYAAKFGLAGERGVLEMSRLTASIASMLDKLVEQTNGHVVFMPTYNVAHENDRNVCEAVGASMRSGRYSIVQTDDPKLYKAITGHLAVMLCGRMHPAILAAAQGTPIVGLAYNPKFYGMFDLLGQRDRCLSIEEFVKDCQTEGALAMLSEAIESPSRFRADTEELANTTRRYIENLVSSKCPPDVPEPEQ